MALVLATTNLHKIRELRALLKPLLTNVDVLSLRDFPDFIPPEETGSTFQANAELKALKASSVLKHHVLSDDSGLCVPALDGRPGIFSSRFAGEGATDKENRNKLLAEMSELTEGQRTAYFTCAMVFASPTAIIRSVVATCDGVIALDISGRHGFGYDPLFLKSGYHRTFAELDEMTKNRISHRRKAFDKLALTIHSIMERACTI